MYKVIAVVICVLMLAGCSANGELTVLNSLRQRMEQSQCCEFTAQVTARHEQQIYRFEMICEDSEDGFCFEVTEPASIRGVTGTVEEKGGNLVFDDCLLAFPLLADGELSPVSAPWLFLRTLKKGLVRHVSKTEEGISVSFEDRFRGEDLISEITLSYEGMPVYCELFWSGQRIIALAIQYYRFS